MSRSLMVAVLVAGCVTAAAGGSYLAVRQNATQPAVALSPEAPAPVATPGAPVQETEAVIEAPASEPTPAPQVEPDLRPVPPAPETRRRVVPAPPREARRAVIKASQNADQPSATPTAPTQSSAATSVATPRVAEYVAPVEAPSEPRPSEPVTPLIEEVFIPGSAVIGLEIETTVSSERARIEDRVDARVARDVFADGRLALPAGSRVIGAVTLVERGGKVQERARLGVRFHTVVLANGRQVPLRTEPIYRDGESPAAESSRKIGGAAIGGAVLGAILGGGKGAIAGATAGAAGGTAAVISGDRNPAVLANGSIVTVKLASPLSFDVER